MTSLTIFVVSCDKQTENHPVSESPSVNILKDSGGGYIGDYRLYQDYDPKLKDAWCSPEPYNCFPIDIVVEPAYKSSMKEVFDAIIGGNPNLIKAAVEKNYSILEKHYIDKNYLDGVLNGSLFIKYGENSKTLIEYMEFVDAGNKTVVVYPYFFK
jgi:hypothetical protein